MSPLGTFPAITSGQYRREMRTVHGWRLWMHHEARRMRKAAGAGTVIVPRLHYLRELEALQILFETY